MRQGLLNFWNNLPAPVRQLLCVGAVGRYHLFRILETAARELSRERKPCRIRMLASLCSQVLLAAWEEDPLYAEAAEQLRRWDSRHPFLDESTAAVVGAVCEASAPENGSFSAVTCPDARSQSSKGGEKKSLDSPFGCRAAYWEAMSRGTYDEARIFLEGTRWPEPLDRLRRRYLASIYLAQGNYDRWEETLTRAGALLSEADRFLHLGNLALVKGDRREARAFWKKCLALRPWLTHLILRCYDTANDRDRFRHPLEGRVSICLYTYNKADLLQDSLAGLAKSRLGAAKISLLVNGCTDDSLQVARCWQDNLGADRLQLIELPINVGAPAARNWLMHDPHVSEADWIAYLDDDALVPEDWIEALGSAVRHYPKAGAWGCRVVDAWVPSTVQAVDYHLLPFPHEDGSKEAAPFFLSTLHSGTPDQGQFNYLRPCIHVTGCCHLFSRTTLLESGDFDLRFSPSQFDDLEHDFRLAFLDKPVVYQGHLAVRHMNSTAKRNRVHAGEMGMTGANLYKLHQKYSREEYRKLICRNMTLIETDLFQKLRETESDEVR